MSTPTKEEAQAALDILTAFVAGGEAGETVATVNIPTPDEVAALSKEEVSTIATTLGLATEGIKSVVLRSMLSTLAKIHHEVETDDDDEINDLAEALGLTPDKKEAKTVAAIKEWATALTSSDQPSDETTEEETVEEETTEEEPAEEEPAAEEEAEEEAPPAKKSKGKAAAPAADEEEATEEEADTEESAEESTEEADSDSDGVDREAIAKTFKKFPDVKTMIAQLDAYNKAAKEEIEYDKKDPKAGYRELIAQLVDVKEEINAWGVAYIRDNEGFCCGLPLSEVKIPNKVAGKCQVTGKTFVLNEAEDGFDEYKAPAKKK